MLKTKDNPRKDVDIMQFKINTDRRKYRATRERILKVKGMEFGTLMFEEVNLIYGKDDVKDKYSDNKDI